MVVFLHGVLTHGRAHAGGCAWVCAGNGACSVRMQCAHAVCAWECADEGAHEGADEGECAHEGADEGAHEGEGEGAHGCAGMDVRVGRLCGVSIAAQCALIWRAQPWRYAS